MRGSIFFVKEILRFLSSYLVCRLGTPTSSMTFSLAKSQIKRSKDVGDTYKTGSYDMDHSDFRNCFLIQRYSTRRFDQKVQKDHSKGILFYFLRQISRTS